MAKNSKKVLGKNDLKWKVNTPGFLKEIMINDGMGILKIPMNIFQRLLAQVAERASELNDKQLNSLMARLALYNICDPTSKDYDDKLTKKIINCEKY